MRTPEVKSLQCRTAAFRGGHSCHTGEAKSRILAYDGFGFWPAARCLNCDRLIRADSIDTASVGLYADRLSVLMTGLPWEALARNYAIGVV